MARTWDQAQQNELEFWKEIYVDGRVDIATYQPINDDEALAFTTKTLERFGEAPAQLEGLTVADIGCGPYGLIKGLQVYVRRGGREAAMVYGVDPLMREYERFGVIDPDPRIRLLAGTGEALPIEPGSCDRVYLVNSLDHVADPATVLDECWRITRPGGSLNVSLHVVRKPFTATRRFLKYIDRNHPHHFSAAAIRRLIEQHCGPADSERVVSIITDQPEFALSHIFAAPQRLRAVKRWGATVALETRYLRATKPVSPE
jgi:SAM-dependent methyltransferase